MLLTKTMINNIPVLIANEGIQSYKAIVIVYHGYRSKKEDYMDRLEFLAKEGFLVVCPDSYDHGARMPENYNEIYQNDCPNLYLSESYNFSKQFLFSVEKTAKEISSLIDYLISRKEFSNHKIGILGESMGGMIAFRAAQLDSRVSALAVIASTPKYPIDFEHSPHKSLEKFFPRPIFMTIAGKDQIFPFDQSKPSVEQLKKIYANHEDKIKCIEFPDANHFMSAEEHKLSWDEARDWLLKCL